MKTGRPQKGPAHVDKLKGTGVAKERLRVVLETLAGTKTIKDACAQLGISESRFDQIRAEALQGAISGLEPRKPGRPPKQIEKDTPLVEELQTKLDEMLVELRVSQTRTEIALTMPHLLKDVTTPPKKNAKSFREMMRNLKDGSENG